MSQEREDRKRSELSHEEFKERWEKLKSEGPSLEEEMQLVRLKHPFMGALGPLPNRRKRPPKRF